MWSQLSNEQKTNYGEEYFERALRSLEIYTEKAIHDYEIFNMIQLLIWLWNSRKPIWDQPFEHFAMHCYVHAHCHAIPQSHPLRRCNVLWPIIYHVVFMMLFTQNRKKHVITPNTNTNKKKIDEMKNVLKNESGRETNTINNILKEIICIRILEWGKRKKKK